MPKPIRHKEKKANTVKRTKNLKKFEKIMLKKYL